MLATVTTQRFTIPLNWPKMFLQAVILAWRMFPWWFWPVFFGLIALIKLIQSQGRAGSRRRRR